MSLLSPHAPFFEGRGIILPPLNIANGLDYGALVKVLMTPDIDTPKTLANALYFIHEMATDEGLDILLPEAERLEIELGHDPTPADVAVQLWLADHDIIERKHAEQHLRNPPILCLFSNGSRSNPGIQGTKRA